MIKKKLSKEEIKKINDHIFKWMQKKREVEHYIIMSRWKKECLKKLKEYKQTIEKYNLHNLQTDTWWTFSQNYAFLSERINNLK